MKNISLYIAFCFISIATSFATTNNRINNTPFIFIENGIEYAVFKNGDFDFNSLQSRSSGVHINTSHLNVSFNSSNNYTPYVQTNQYGVITRINNTSIQYNYNGKVQRIGSVVLKYNNYGYVYAIGNLNIRYSDYGNNYYCTGYVNSINSHYTPVYRNYRSTKRYQIAKVNNRYPSKKRSHYGTSRNYYPKKYNTIAKVKKSNKRSVKSNYKTKNNKSYAYRTNSNSYRR